MLVDGDPGQLPRNFPALPSRLKSFQIVMIAVDNLQDPRRPFEATEQ
jgi:hypothetical protein